MFHIKVNIYNLAHITQLLDLEYKYEVTLQKLSYLEKERDSFQERYRLNLHAIEQRSGLRVIIFLFRI